MKHWMLNVLGSFHGEGQDPLAVARQRRAFLGGVSAGPKGSDMGMGQHESRGPKVLVLVAIYQGNPFWVPIFDPQQYLRNCREPHSLVCSGSG